MASFFLNLKLRFYTIAVFRVEENPATMGWSQIKQQNRLPKPPQEEASEVGSWILGVAGWLGKSKEKWRLLHEVIKLKN